MAVTVGNANVRILPDTRGFKQKLESELKRLKDVEVQVGVDFDADGLVAKAKAAAEEASKAAKIHVDMDVDRRFKADFDRNGLVHKVHDAVSDAEGKPISLQFDVDPAALGGKVRAARMMAQRMAGRIELSMGLKDGAALKVAMQAAAVSADMFGASLMRNAVTALPQFIGSAGAAAVAVGGLAGPLAATASAALSAIGPVTALGATLAPAAISSAALAVGVLKSSFNGFGDALKAADPAAFAEAIADLPPAAQAGATALYELKTQMSDMGSEIQESFWSNFSNLGNLGALIEPLRQAMTGLAADMGTAASGLVDFVAQGPGLSAMQTLLDAGAAAGSALSFAFADVVKALIAIGAAAAPIFTDLAQKLAQVAETWAGNVVTAFQNGDLQAFFQGAVEKAQQMWIVLQQVGSIVSGVFSAMNAAGQPFLGTIGQIIAATAEWVNSAQGMETLTSFFSSMGAAVATILPILTQLAGIIGGTVAPAIAGFIEAVGPGLQSVVDGLATGLAAIAPAVAPLGAAFGQLLTAASPLLGIIGQLVGQLAGALTPVISALAPIFSALMPVFAAIGQTLGVVAQVIGSVLAAALQAVAPLFQALSVVMQPLSMAFQQVAEVLGGVLVGAIQAIAPLFQMLGQAIVAMMPAFTQLAETFAGLLAQALQMIVPLLPPLVQAFMSLLQAILPLLPAIMQIAGTLMSAIMPVIMQLLPIIINLATTIVSALVPVIAALVPAVIAVGNAFATIIAAIMPIISVILQVAGVFLQLVAVIVGFAATAIATIVNFVAQVVAGFANMVALVVGLITTFVGNVLSFLLSLASSAIATVSNMWAAVSSAFSTGVSTAVNWVAGLPGRALAALGNVGSTLLASGQALIQGFVNGIMSMVGRVRDAVSNVVSAARNFFPFSPAKEGPFSGKGWVLYSGRSIGSAFAQGIKDTTPDAVRASAGLMGATASNLNGYQAGVGLAAGRPGAAGGFGSGVDTSVHIGQIVAADVNAPLREARTMQLRAQIKAGVA